MRDHITRWRGKFNADITDPLRLNGGLLHGVQQLQESGHCRVGFTAYTDSGAEITLPKPKKRRSFPAETSEDSDQLAPELRLRFSDIHTHYPFDTDHLSDLISILQQFHSIRRESED
jgi:hypothetical protein